VSVPLARRASAALITMLAASTSGIRHSLAQARHSAYATARVQIETLHRKPHRSLVS
jgi:hypothetical protein